MINSRETVVAGIPTRFYEGGRGQNIVLFLHGAIPGVTPYCGGSHVWRETLDDFVADHKIVAIDMLGSGGTGLATTEAPLTVDRLGEHVLATLGQIGVERCHVVGHDVGGLVGAWLAMRDPERFSALSVVASAAAAPIGDWVDDLVFLDPPPPFWSRASQAWALDRISYTPHHIDEALLDACTLASDQSGPRVARTLMESPIARAAFAASMSRTKARLWALSRDSQLQVPTQVIWAANDPLTTPAHGLTLFQTIGIGQPLAQYHLVNRSGSFLFREHPAQFRRLLTAFEDGLATTSPLYRYA
jgi:2-hydroxy-6-oxonona-2,4-dienedioate hydrolase